MAATAQATKNQITLKGSVATVTEFFQYALSSILYQRGVYAPESFEPKKAYGLTVMCVKEDKLANYLQAVLRQFSGKRQAAARANAACRGLSPPARVSCGLLLPWSGADTHSLALCPCSSCMSSVAGGRSAAEGGACRHQRRLKRGAGAVDV